MDDELLSMQDKRRFFRRLDALLAASASSSASSSRDRADAPAPFTRDTAAERNDHSERSDPNGKEGGDGAGRGDRASQRCDPQPTAAKSNTKRAAVAMAGKRKTPSQSEQSKRKKQAPAEQQQLLYGQRVLLVPVGPDVGRRRLEIWQDMVVKLGGSVVASAAPKSRRAAKPSVDWADVDVAIASAQLEPQKAREHYGEATFPPTGVHVYTPEWLVFMLREHRLPPPEANLEWAQHKAAQASADAHRSDASGENFDKDDEEAAESDGGDGSNPYRAGSGEIERAPPVRIDAERVREEEVKLQKEKDRLVQERSVAFYKNNPGFVALAERGRQPGGEEHRQVKPETFVCRQSSRTYFYSPSVWEDGFANLDTRVMISDASQFERALDGSAGRTHGVSPRGARHLARVHVQGARNCSLPCHGRCSRALCVPTESRVEPQGHAHARVQRQRPERPLVGKRASPRQGRSVARDGADGEARGQEEQPAASGAGRDGADMGRRTGDGSKTLQVRVSVRSDSLFGAVLLIVSPR